MTRWCHSAAQLGDVVTKDSDAARAPWELFVRRGFLWRSLHDPKFESSRNRARRGHDILEEPDENEFGDDGCSTRSEECHVKCMFRQFFRNFGSCTLVLDSGSLHQKPLILNIEVHLCWFPGSEATDPEIVLPLFQFRAS